MGRWIVLNSEDCEDRIKSRMYMLMGRVNTALVNSKKLSLNLPMLSSLCPNFKERRLLASSMGY